MILFCLAFLIWLAGASPGWILFLFLMHVLTDAAKKA